MKKSHQPANARSSAPVPTQENGPIPWLQVGPFFIVIAALAGFASFIVVTRVFHMGEVRLVLSVLLGIFVASRWLAQPYTRIRPLMSGVVWVVSQVVLVGLLYLTLP